MKNSEDNFTDDQDDRAYDTHCRLYETFPRLVSQEPSVLTLVELLMADGYDLGEAANMISSRAGLTRSIKGAILGEAELTVSGFVPSAEIEDSSFKLGWDAFVRLRNELWQNKREFELVCYVLNEAPKSQEVNIRFDLYDLKDRLEAYIEKRTNVLSVDIGIGTILAAALHCGFDYNRSQDGSLVCINLSDEAYDQLGSRHCGDGYSAEDEEQDSPLPENVVRLY